MKLVFFMALAILAILCAGCASGGANNTGAEVISGIIQGIGAGLSGL